MKTIWTKEHEGTSVYDIRQALKELEPRDPNTQERLKNTLRHLSSLEARFNCEYRTNVLLLSAPWEPYDIDRIAACR